MVLLNGVKYACDRCIRGHRATSCTHTDQPLTMIKSKGRPASQCQHCRDQRKMKNVHANCNCGKKGKSPGQHLASCVCYKDSHCTCPNKEKKANNKKKVEPMSTEHSDPARAEPLSHHRSSLRVSDFSIEDVAIPFEADEGLLDYLSSPSSFSDSSNKMYGIQEPHATNLRAQGASPFIRDTSQTLRSSNSSLGQSHAGRQQAADRPNIGQPHSSQNIQNLTNFPNPPTDADLDLVESMFPLFPLVGFNSFEDDKSLPLSALPPSNSFIGETLSSDPILERGGIAQRSEIFPTVNTRTKSNHNHMGPGPTSNSYSNQHSSASLNHTIGSPNPQRVRDTSLSGNGTSHSFRPRRSESVLSAASTSSNISKHNFFDTPINGSIQFPKTPSSAALHQLSLSQNNSHDGINQTYVNSPDLSLENHSLYNLSDEDTQRSGKSGYSTPQHSIPSRSLSQSKKKLPLSRSHSQIHHNGVSKERFPLHEKTASSAESLSHLINDRMFSPYQGQSKHSVQEPENYLRDVAEEFLPEVENGAINQANSSANLPNKASNHDTFYPPLMPEAEELSQIPMYQELFESTQNGW